MENFVKFKLEKSDFKNKRFVILCVIFVFSFFSFVFLKKAGPIIPYLRTAPVSVGTSITNTARVVYEDDSGGSYGPVYSNEAIVFKIAAPVSPANKFSIQFSKERQTNYQEAATLRFKNASGQIVREMTVSTNVSGKSGDINNPAELVNGQSYGCVLKVRYHLTKRIDNVVWPPSSFLDFGELLAGNLIDTDNTVDSADFSYLGSKWRTNDSVADINKDGIVNAIDWGIMNKNWHITGTE
ncbi:MAG: hypothetical protein PHU56_00820 [Candidatus Pacebacteria bacterium]|nr:hypothetical protein [Candidatus Paceibacterota bacterium]